MELVRTYIGLGANLGDAQTTLTEAVGALAKLPGARLAGVSSLYVTRPVDVTDQPEFHNAVVGLDLSEPSGTQSSARSGAGGSGSVRSRAGDAIALLLALKSIERGFGRQPRARFGPRELDLDLLIFGGERLAVERPVEGRSADPAKVDQLLVVPHPRARDRLFVLAPLAELAPDLVPPGWTVTVVQARDERAAIEGPDAVRRVAVWDPELGEWN